MHRRRAAAWALLLGACLASPGAGMASPALGMASPAAAQTPAIRGFDPLTGSRSRLRRDWVGQRPVAPDVAILVLAGHADSQGMQGAGTSGEAVDRRGASPMQPGICDELYWNLAVARAVAALGQRRGLNIRFYEPPLRRIVDTRDPRTNWSVGQAHAAQGGYALELHFDAYGPDGVGSGLIPALHRPFSQLDESLAEAFGGYPMWFRGGLGGPRRGISLLEIGKLEAPLEPALRDPNGGPAALAAIAERVVTALEQGLSRRPDGAGSGPQARRPAASSGGE